MKIYVLEMYDRYPNWWIVKGISFLKYDTYDPCLMSMSNFVVVVVVVVVVRNAPYLQRDKGPSLNPTLVAQQGTFQPSGSVISRTSGIVTGYKQERCSWLYIPVYVVMIIFWSFLILVTLFAHCFKCMMILFFNLFWLDLGYAFAGRYSILSPRFL